MKEILGWTSLIPLDIYWVCINSVTGRLSWLDSKPQILSYTHLNVDFEQYIIACIYGFMMAFKIVRMDFIKIHWLFPWLYISRYTIYWMVICGKLQLHYFLLFPSKIFDLHNIVASRLAFPDENNSSLQKISKLEDPSQYSRLGLVVRSFGLSKFHWGSSFKFSVCFVNLQPRRADLDMNQHVNNVTYIGWVLEVGRSFTSS